MNTFLRIGYFFDLETFPVSSSLSISAILPAQTLQDRLPAGGIAADNTLPSICCG
jgi:hypothetical protein